MHSYAYYPAVIGAAVAAAALSMLIFVRFFLSFFVMDSNLIRSVINIANERIAFLLSL